VSSFPPPARCLISFVCRRESLTTSHRSCPVVFPQFCMFQSEASVQWPPSVPVTRRPPCPSPLRGNVLLYFSSFLPSPFYSPGDAMRCQATPTNTTDSLTTGLTRVPPPRRDSATTVIISLTLLPQTPFFRSVGAMPVVPLQAPLRPPSLRCWFRISVKT